jgi:hypothetical protein
MTPDEFANHVMPRILSAWRCHCLCANAGFRRLLSFNFTDYSISMYRSFFRFLNTPAMADYGLYLVGMRAFSRDDFMKVHDFREATSIDEFLSFIGIAEQSGEREPPMTRNLKS